jgi:hypothetical protein
MDRAWTVPVSVAGGLVAGWLIHYAFAERGPDLVDGFDVETGAQGTLVTVTCDLDHMSVREQGDEVLIGCWE